MRLLQVILLVLAGFFVRRLWLRATRGPRRTEAGPERPRATRGGRRDLDHLTQQGIDDADFEEIP